MENIELWNKNCGKEYNLVKMIYFHCSQDILEKRLEGRSDKTGRSDDSKEVVAKRMATYKKETAPVVSYYDSRKLCIYLSKKVSTLTAKDRSRLSTDRFNSKSTSLCTRRKSDCRRSCSFRAPSPVERGPKQRPSNRSSAMRKWSPMKF